MKMIMIITIMETQQTQFIRITILICRKIIRHSGLVHQILFLYLYYIYIHTYIVIVAVITLRARKNRFSFYALSFSNHFLQIQ